MRARTYGLRLATLTLALLAAAPAAAQAVRGRVTEPGTDGPVAGAVVMLLDANGARVTATLTDAQGAFALRAAGPGTYSLRAERVDTPPPPPPPCRWRMGRRPSRRWCCSRGR